MKRRNAGSVPKASKQVYLFVVTSLTLFLFSQIIWRSPITGYVATATIEFDCSASDFASPPREADVRRVLETHNLPDHILARVEHLQSYITVRTVRSSSERSAYEIRFVGTTSDEATKFANAVADHISELSNTQNNSQPILVKNAETALRQARQLEGELQVELASLISNQRIALEEQIEQARTASLNKSSGDVLESLAFTQYDDKQPDQRVNPEWERLNLEFREATARADQLKVNHTADHPLLQTNSLEAEQLKNRLAATPRVLKTQPEFSRGGRAPARLAMAPPVNEAGNPEVVALPCGEVQQRLQEVSRLAESIRCATSARVAAEDEFARCAAQVRHSHTRVTTTPARIVASIGGTPTLSKLAQLLLVSLSLGGIVAVLAGRATSCRVLRDARDIAQQLDLPVVSTLSLANRRPAFAFRVLQRSALTATRLCEMALMALAVFIVLVALTDSRLATGFLDVPFQTFSEVFERYSP